MQTHINKIGEHVGQGVTIKGWLHNRRSSGKIHFLVVRDGTGFLQVVMGKKDVDEATFQTADHLGQESAIIITGTVKAEARAAGGYEMIASGLEVVNQAHDYPITPKEHGVDYLMDRRHLWIRAERQTAILQGAPRDHQRGPRLLQRPGLHPRRHTDLHAGGVRGHHHALPGRVLRRSEGLPDAERAALQRGQRHGPRQGLRVRADVPRREEQDAPPPHRVLDGRAGDGLRRPQ